MIMDRVVSIIMNCLNGEKYLRQAIDSVYAQTFKDWEIIFWDNASADGTRDIAGSYDGKLRYFRSESTMPLSKARNMALEKARGKYIAFLDCDDIWSPSKLEMQIPALDNDLEVGLVYSNFYKLFPNGKKTIALKGKQPSGHIFGDLLYTYPIGMLTAILRKNAIDLLGSAFDESLRIAEDYDLFMRILHKNKVAYTAEPLAVYRFHENRTTLVYQDRYVDECEYVIDKLKKQDAEFAGRYGKALVHIERQMRYLRAKMAMSKGDAAAARMHLGSGKWKKGNLFLIYLATYLPQAVWRKVSIMRNEGFLY